MKPNAMRITQLASALGIVSLAAACLAWVSANAATNPGATQSAASPGSSMPQSGPGAEAKPGSSSNLLVRSAQQALADRGYDVGPIDGQLGSKTADALRKFQAKIQLPVTGRLDSRTVAALHLEATAPISMNGANS